LDAINYPSSSLLLIILTVIYLNLINEKNIQGTAEFKVAQLERVMADSLSARHKVEQLASETEKFGRQIIGLFSHEERVFLLNNDPDTAGCK
jgi:hypothetical protein